MAVLRARLQCVDALGAAQYYDVSSGGVCGRDPTADIVLDHPTVSRRHARFTLRGGELEIQDLGSVNGSWINGRQLDHRPCMLADGDYVRIGHLQLRLHLTPLDAMLDLTPTAPAQGSVVQTMHAGMTLDPQLLLARLAQRRMLVEKPPAIAGYEFGSVILPAQGVGGDLIHWGAMAGDRYGLVIGDVCGKGVAAAMVMAFVSGLLFEAVPACDSAVGLLERVNGILHRVLEPGLFVTAIAVVLDPSDDCIEVANAGHAPPLLKRVGGMVASLPIAPGVALGPQAKPEFGAALAQLQPGETLLLTTDGIEEAQDVQGQELGRDRVIEVLRESAGAVDVARRLTWVVAQHSARAKQHDDLTAVAIERCSGG